MRLETKLLLLFFAVSLVFACLLGLSSRRAVHGVLVANLEAPARAHARDVSRSLSAGLAPGSAAPLANYLRGCLGSFGAVYAAAVDKDGRVLQSQNTVAMGRSAGEILKPWPAALKAPWSRESVLAGRPVLELALPGEGSGALLLGFPLQEALDTESRIAVKVFLFAGAAGGMALALLLFFMRGLLAPVRRLTLGVEKLSRGQYGTEVRVDTHDEIGDLARSFNQMSLDLARTTVSKDYLTDILDNMLDGVFVTGADGRIRTVNPSLLRLLGYEASDLLGSPASRLLESDAQDDAGALDNVERRLARKDGRWIPVLLSRSPLRACDGLPTGMVFAARDYAESKRKDAELKEREAQLRHSDKLSAVGRLAAGIAHEINNPLGSILGFAQAAAARLKAADALLPPLQAIEEEARRCRGLVQSLLSYSGQRAPAMEEFELNAAVETTLAMVEAQARVNGVQIARELGSHAVLRGDRGQLQQVVMNLCTNGIDAMPMGGRLAVRCGAAGDNAVFLEVEDDGAGIPEALRSKVFDPFFTTKDAGKGTGLGLSLVHDIVMRHKGTIDVRSAPGGGALFRVVLPRG